MLRFSEHQVKETPAPMKYVFSLVFLVSLALVNHNGVYAAGECGKAFPEREAWKLASCIAAAQDENAPVSDRCCSQIEKLGQDPARLCAVMLENTDRSAGVKPEVAVTIPKRCGIANRPMGYKCGAYLLP